MKHCCVIIVTVVCVCTIATMYSTLSNETRAPARVVPCKNAHCGDVTKNEVDINEHVQILRGRASTLQEKCNQMYGMQKDNETTPRKPLFTNHFLVSDKYKLVYCFIPKVACSNVKRMFLILNGVVKTTNPVDITNRDIQRTSRRRKILSSYSMEGIRYRLSNYTIVMSVRDPFERLISAFNDKVKSNYQGIQNKIIRKLQPKVHKGNVTFANFIQYMIMENDKNKAFDVHYTTFTRICEPCRVQYDYIGNYEDMAALLKDIGADFIHFPTRKDIPQYRSTTPTADLLEQFYKDVPDSHIKRLKEIYAKDILLFGLKVPKAVARLEEGVKQT